MADNNFDSEESGLLERIKESPRTVSALIIILIVAAAIYAFSGDNAQNNQQVASDEVKVGEELAPEDTTTESDEAVVAVNDQATAESDANIPTAEVELPTPSKTGQEFVEVAGRGEGLTHLARRATGRWLIENQAGYTVTNEHRIFIEDYIKDAIGAQSLSLGEQVPVSFGLIAEAVAAANKLSPEQLQNLTQYSQMVNWAG